MYKILIITTMLAFNSVSTVNAQSISVGSDNLKTINLDGKFTKLKQLVDALSTKITTVNDELQITKVELSNTDDLLNKLKFCNDTEKIYDPNGADADGNGCVAASKKTLAYTKGWGGRCTYAAIPAGSNVTDYDIYYRWSHRSACSWRRSHSTNGAGKYTSNSSRKICGTNYCPSNGSVIVIAIPK